MPELPEVETVVRSLRPILAARKIIQFESRWPRQVSPDVASVAASLKKRTVDSISRRGKWIVANLRGGGALLVHLRMSGRFEWTDLRPARKSAQPPAEPAHVRATFDLDDGRRVYFCDARKFGRISLIGDPAELDDTIGVEPLSRGFTEGRLAELLRQRGRAIKPLLLDQAVIAGLGNIYTDEALHRAGLHPLTPSDRVAPARVAALHRSIRDVLRDGIRRNGASIDWVYPGGDMQNHFLVYGRAAQPCSACGTIIVRLLVGQRGTHICPRCQPAPGRRPATRHV